MSDYWFNEAAPVDPVISATDVRARVDEAAERYRQRLREAKSAYIWNMIFLLEHSTLSEDDSSDYRMLLALTAAALMAMLLILII